ncbi:2-hydroxychromene-2-carboxylate isomerase [Ottowia caeni]|uniref:2-hydroxychromene-2-carboxylate isomerase n=1 Tax=Ottowia caeni TaxID=2870339 RepID=UPI001E356A6A|nr:2-hydroxychromene-2-carboxylate isomerase [Ottowia caeni]
MNKKVLEQVSAHENVQVRFYFDFLSPYAYLAQHRLKALSASHGWQIDFRSIDLSQAKKAIGNVGPANRDMPVKLAYLAKDLSRWAALYGIPLTFPPNYNSSGLNVGLYYGPCKGREAEYVSTAYGLVWGLGQAPDDPKTLESVASHMKWDVDDFIEFTHSEPGLQAYRKSTEDAIAQHIFGVPTMAVGDEMWWGNDRLSLLEKHLTKETTE